MRAHQARERVFVPIANRPLLTTGRYVLTRVSIDRSTGLADKYLSSAEASGVIALARFFQWLERT